MSLTVDKLEMSQSDLCIAVEYYLNREVLKSPHRVAKVQLQYDSTTIELDEPDADTLSRLDAEAGKNP